MQEEPQIILAGLLEVQGMVSVFRCQDGICWGDWAFRFKQGVRSIIIDVYQAPMHRKWFRQGLPQGCGRWVTSPGLDCQDLWGIVEQVVGEDRCSETETGARVWARPMRHCPGSRLGVAELRWASGAGHPIWVAERTTLLGKPEAMGRYRMRHAGKRGEHVLRKCLPAGG